MTIQDIIEAGVQFQGPCKVISYTHEGEVTRFDYDGQELGSAKHWCEDWFAAWEITYIHPIEGHEGVVIEVAY